MRGGPQKKTRALLAEAQDMKARGFNYKHIANVLGMSGSTIIRIWLDPKYAEKKRREARERRSQIAFHCAERDESWQLARDAAKLKEQIPPDTRDLTARLCGDPVPGRRAIDKISVESLCTSAMPSSSCAAQGVK